MKKRSIKAAPLLLLFVLFVCAGGAEAAAEGPLAQRTGFYFDTVVNIALYDTDDEAVLDACFEKMAYYEQKFSRTVEGSDVWNINHAGGESVEVCDETADMIARALVWCEKSDGAFDITIAPVVDLWDFSEGAQPALPDADSIGEALSHVDYHCIEQSGSSIRLSDPKAGVDLGAIAKGYISDGLRDVIISHGCNSALINLGGNVLAVGAKSGDKDFKIGIRRPFGTDAYDLIRVLGVRDCSVITSGTYERYFELDGVIYHHILDVHTGYPVDNSLTSVSILSADSTDGDALSTTCFALGEEKGMELIESLEGVEAMFIDENEEIRTSSGWPEP